jgi:hypothetical protein
MQQLECHLEWSLASCVWVDGDLQLNVWLWRLRLLLLLPTYCCCCCLATKQPAGFCSV